MGLPYWSRGTEGDRLGAFIICISAGAAIMSMDGPFGDLSVGLRLVKGILSSLLRSSFFSNEAKTGSFSASLAPLITGIVSWREAATAADCCAWRLKKFSPRGAAGAAGRGGRGGRRARGL